LGIGKKILSTLICLLIVTSSFAQVSVNITASSNPVCKGSSSVLTANVSGGLPPYTYHWSDNSTSTSITVYPTSTSDGYSVTVTDKNSASNTAQTYITIDIFTVKIIVTNNSDSSKLSPSWVGGMPPFACQWNTGQNTLSITVVPTTATIYSVTVTDENGCWDSASVHITPSSVHDYINNIIVNLVPNPANNFVELEKNNNETDKYLLSINDIQGREVLTKNIQFDNKYNIDLTGFTNGLYFLKLQNDKEITLSKIIVQH